jgi:catechol 2,3-dioxygenase-like lactoylglutathione lyase family enzyme
VLTRLDHLVILVRDLDRAVRDYEGLGFTVTPGGKHADGLTRNGTAPTSSLWPFWTRMIPGTTSGAGGLSCPPVEA